MKVVNLFLKSLFVVFAATMFIGCDEPSEPVPYYPISEVTKYERDLMSMSVSYGRDGLSEYNLSVNGDFVEKSFVNYSASNISCHMKGVRYDVQLSSTRGARRAESVKATIGQSILFEVEYFYEHNRLKLARINGGEFVKPAYVRYTYEGNRVIIHDDIDGKDHIFELSNEDNKGYVCNALDFTSSPLTSQYVIHPDLYYLNIYGAPFEKLPAGQEVEYTADGQKLARVGKYTYTY